MTCELCMAMQGKEAKVFEDQLSAAVLHPRGAAPGHLIVMPRAHHSIMEQVPDEELRHLFRVTKLMAASLDKGLGCKDLDVIISNGHAAGQEFPHFSIQVIPRGKGDAVKIGWEPMTFTKEEMDSIEAGLKEACGGFNRDKPVSAPVKESYQLRPVVRIP